MHDVLFVWLHDFTLLVATWLNKTETMCLRVSSLFSQCRDEGGAAMSRGGEQEQEQGPKWRKDAERGREVCEETGEGGRGGGM